MDMHDEIQAAKHYYDSIRVAYDQRIAQIWKSRYAIWGFHLTVGAFLFVDGEGLSTPLRILVFLVLVAVTIIQLIFEREQERVLRKDRKILYRVRRLISAALNQDASSFGEIKIESNDAELDKVGVIARLELWWVTVILAMGLFSAIVLY